MTLRVETEICAPVEVCFDMARDVGLHCRTAARTQERAVAGVTEGLLELGDEVTFEGVHFGIRQQLSARIVEFDRPNRFADEMTRGAFQSLRHIHEFFPMPMGTRMRDTLEWTAPFGFLGRLADFLFLKSHMRRFLRARNAALKAFAESGVTL